MNKQAFAFLTLFTLALMMAVYYVTLPLENPVTDGDQLITLPLESTTYEDDLENKHAEVIEYNEGVVADDESSTQAKLEALENIGAQQQIVSKEDEVGSTLDNSGFTGCIVEIEEEVVRVLCPNEYNTKENAILILTKVYTIISTDLLVEVSFE